MPWNCLCAASDEKPKLEISAPILKPEDRNKLQIITPTPLKSSTLPHTPKRKHEQQPQPPQPTPQEQQLLLQQQELQLFQQRKQHLFNRSYSSDCERNSSGSDINNASIKRKHLTKTKKLQRSSSETAATTITVPTTKELQSTLKGSIKNRSSTRKHPANVKFSFDDNDTNNNNIEPLLENNNNDNNQKKGDDSATTTTNIGNYDELPLLVSLKTRRSNSVCGVHQYATISEPFNRIPLPPRRNNSHENLFSTTVPYVEDDINHTYTTLQPQPYSHHHQQVVTTAPTSVTSLHNERYITLHPQNVASVQTLAKNYYGKEPEKYVQQTTLYDVTTCSMPTCYDMNGNGNGNGGNATTTTNTVTTVQPTTEQPSPLPPHPQPILKRNPTLGMMGKSFAIIQEEIEIPPENSHNFQFYVAGGGNGARICQVCHEPLMNEVVKCGDCDLTCHGWCVSLIVAKNSTHSHNDSNISSQRSNHDDVNERISITKSQTLPLQPIYQKNLPENLKIQYVTQRILASVLPRRETPAGGKGATPEPDRHEREVIAMLEHKHGKHYRLFDLESCISLVTLERVCELCKHIDVWLGTTPENVVVLQDREGSQRLGTAIAAYLEYLDVCVANCHKRKGISNEDVRASNAIAKNWLDLDIISLKKFLSVSIGPLRIPSNRRYITYFSGLLSGQIKLNAEPIYLKYMNVISPPTWLQQHQQRNGVVGPNSSTASSSSSSHNQGEWNSFVKIYEGLQCVYTSDIHIIPITTRQFLFEIGNLRLRGDILIRCYQVLTSGDSNNLNNQDTRELLYSIQFHTCAIKTNEFTFTKEEMDYAWQDSRFPKDFRVTFHLSPDQNGGNQQQNGYIFQSPLVRTVAPTDLAKANSIENINLDYSRSYQTEALLGPVDGSLYATILKSPTKSKSDTPLLSPPPQFSNHTADCTVIERQPLSSSTPIRNSYSSGSHQRSYSSSTTSQSTVREVSVPPRTSSLVNSATTTPDYCYLENPPPRSSTSQSNYSQNPVIITEIITNGQNGIINGNRESVKSPLTLSMDSGISSNCLNRPLARSSVSPLSFPSQNSPQDDRQRELDDILSDMLMTVNEIPDFRKKHTQTTTTTQHSQQHSQKLQRSQSVIPAQSLSSQYLQVALPTASSTNTLNRNHHHQVTRELLYDTASTATTITPPCSESGRDTPHQQHHQSSATLLTRQKRETFGGMASSSQQASNRSLSIQSLNYPQTVRSTSQSQSQSNRISNSTTEDEDNIPYHAREHSQPFSYGNIIPNGGAGQEPDPRMIKAQTGLTSPTLVRKAFNNRLSSTSSTSNLSSNYNTASTMRKNQIDSDFEDMLRERREKYSISDKPRTNGYQSHQPQQQTYYTTTETLRRSHQPMMDRSMSSEEISLQSWLALQQEKLRAKKEQQYKTHERKYLDEIHTEIRSRPQRSRNVPVRYDGYQSDTAAFASDDVDFRRPLHIQTPSARSPDRYHNTFTKTSVTTSTKERPHVGVQRAHKMDQALSPTLSPLEILKASPPTGHVTQSHLQKVITSSSNLNNSNNHSSSLVSVNSSNQNGLLSMAESPKVQRNGQMRLMREESFSSYRSETEPELSMAGSPSRPETPGFPVTPRTPYGFSNGSISPALPPKSPNSQRKDLSTGMQRGNIHDFMNQNDTITQYARRNSNASSEPQEVAPHYVKFVRDSSKYWYKPNISREEAINLLRNANPGTFIVRDSTTFKNAYGLVLRVAHPPQGVVAKPGSDELVRHFLVEPTSRGVRLKGCPNEPVFTSLSALVYQHSITPLALPCRLLIPDRDIAQIEHTPAQKQLLAQGAACNVLYLFSCETESLTGEEAVRRAVRQLYSTTPLPKPIEVHFKVSQQGITLTDNTRQKFFRKHYNPNMVSFCGLDPDNSMWSVPSSSGNVAIAKKSVFAFVARRTPTSVDNMCHVFCDLQPNQPSTAIVSFVNKVLPTEKSINFNI